MLRLVLAAASLQLAPAGLRPVIAQRFPVTEREVLMAAASHLLKSIPDSATVAIASMEEGLADHASAIAEAVRGNLLNPGESPANCVNGKDAAGYNVRRCRLAYDYVLRPMRVEISGTTAIACFMKESMPHGRPYAQTLRLHLWRNQSKWKVTKVELLGES